MILVPPFNSLTDNTLGSNFDRGSFGNSGRIDGRSSRDNMRKGDNPQILSQWKQLNRLVFKDLDKLVHSSRSLLVWCR